MENDYSEQIDYFLRNQMTEEERLAFKQQIEANPVLKQQVREHLLLIRAIQETGKEKDKEIINSVKKSTAQPLRKKRLYFRFLAVAASVALLFVVGHDIYYYVAANHYANELSVQMMSEYHASTMRGVEDEDVANAHIEEYVSGCNYCIHYFYSALDDTVEVMGMDSRYESSIDGFVRMPAKNQLDIDLSPSYVVTGNHPVVIRESLLTQVFEIGDKLVASAKELVSPGMNGPFCMQTLVNDNLEVICFEISARTDGGTNTFMNGSSYSYLSHGEPMSMGRRIAREIKKGIEREELDKIIT